MSSASTHLPSPQSALAVTHDLLTQLAENQRSESEIEAEITQLLQTSISSKGFFLGCVSSFAHLSKSATDVLTRGIESASDQTIQYFLENTAVSAAIAVYYQKQKNTELAGYYEQLKARSILFLKTLSISSIDGLAKEFLQGLITYKGRYQKFLESWNFQEEQKQAIAQTLSLINQTEPIIPAQLTTPIIPDKKWIVDYDQRPWLDLEAAENHLNHQYQNQKISQQEFHWLKQWREEGYFIANHLIDISLIDQMNQELDDLWYREEPIPGALFHDLGLNPQESRTYTHAEILNLEIEIREKMRDQSRWRIHGVQQLSSTAQQIFNHPKLKEISSLILGQPTQPHFSISFRRGSEQALHEDMSVFHILPLNHLLGVWIATEDISPDSGPLVYYPGSHHAKLYKAFDRYPQTNLRTLQPEQMQDYYDYVEQRVKDRYPRKRFIAQKGQVLFWHGMLVHGGLIAKDPNLTRKSLVLHFVAEGANRDGEVYGPFNW